MPLPGPPAEKEPPPPIIMFSTAKGMKSASCRDDGSEVGRGRTPGPGGTRPAGTHQEGAALQADHDVRELGEGGGAQADVGHVSLQL